jgi:hypothetical protein
MTACSAGYRALPNTIRSHARLSTRGRLCLAD